MLGPGLAPPGLQAPSCPLPTRSAPVLVSLGSREAPLASHLGLGWASASWLPRLTQSWAGANSELSECGRVEGGCRELGRDRPPPPSHRGWSKHCFPLSFYNKSSKCSRLYRDPSGAALLPTDTSAAVPLPGHMSPPISTGTAMSPLDCAPIL